MYNEDHQWSKPVAYSEVGQSHASNNEPCQDAYCINTRDNGWVSIVVCDGAGSALHGKAGAKFFSQKFSEVLIEISKKVDVESPGSWINDAIVAGILGIRNELRDISSNGDIKDYHCTLLALLLSPHGGFSVHIGDGVIFGGTLEDSNDNIIAIDAKYFVSRPENGEYLNETYFVTESIWTKHLRINPLPYLDWICLATDGGASLSLDRDCNINEHFLPSVFEHISNIELNGGNIVELELKKQKYKRATTDDKTIVFVYRKKIEALQNKIFKNSLLMNREPVIYGEQKKSKKNDLLTLAKIAKETSHENVQIQVKENKNRHLLRIIFLFLALFVSFNVVLYKKFNFNEMQTVPSNDMIESKINDYIHKESTHDWELTKYFFLQIFKHN